MLNQDFRDILSALSEENPATLSEQDHSSGLRFISSLQFQQVDARPHLSAELIESVPLQNPLARWQLSIE